jgi:hypothetical protein
MRLRARRSLLGDLGVSRSWLGGELAGWGECSPVPVQDEAVDREGVADEVEELAFTANGVGASEPAGVVEGAVDGFGVGAAVVERDVLGV